MADDETPAGVVCASGCGTRGDEETLELMDDGQYQCRECLGAVIARGSLDEIMPREDASLTRPNGDPDEAMHRGAA